MPVREVALDRDVRSPRLLPVATSVFSFYFARRVLSVAALLTIDVGAVLLALLAESHIAGAGAFEFWPGLSRAGLVTYCLVIVACAALAGLYGRRHTRHRLHRVVAVWTAAFVVSSMLMLAVNPDSLGARLVAVWLTAIVLDVVARWVFDELLALVFGTESEYPRVLLLGSRAACDVALPTLDALPPEERVSVVGLVVPAEEYAAERGRRRAAAATRPRAGMVDRRTDTPPVVAAHEGLLVALRSRSASEVIIADPMSLNGQMRDVMDACRECGATLKVVAATMHHDARAIGYVAGLDCPLFVVQPKPAGWASYLVKQIVDRVVAVACLVLLAPLFLVLAALITATSRGPVFFVDRRVGLGQRPFRLYKFRTMRADAHRQQAELEAQNEACGVLFKIRDDPRVTGVGRVLRRLSLDELPQLINVVKGDMSLVGPRPLPMRDCELMEDWHRRRHVVLPGITGLWQVSGRSDLKFTDMVELDLRYIDTWSLRSDVRIAWLTLAAVLGARGAY